MHVGPAVCAGLDAACMQARHSRATNEQLRLHAWQRCYEGLSDNMNLLGKLPGGRHDDSTNLRQAKDFVPH